MAQLIDNKLSNTDILKQHIKNNTPNTTLEETQQALASAIKSGFKVIRLNDILVAFKKTNKKTALMYIFNGADAKQYLRGVKQFIEGMKKAGFLELEMYISDKQSSSKIALASGVKNVSFVQDPKRKTDPYLMTMEL